MLKLFKKIIAVCVLGFIFLISCGSKSYAGVMVLSRSDKSGYSITYTKPEDVEDFMRLLCNAYTTYSGYLCDSMCSDSEYDDVEDSDDSSLKIPYEKVWLDFSYTVRNLGGRKYDLQMSRFLAHFVLNFCKQDEFHRVDVLSLTDAIESIVRDVYRYDSFSVSACRTTCGKGWDSWSLKPGNICVRKLPLKKIIADCIR